MVVAWVAPLREEELAAPVTHSTIPTITPNMMQGKQQTQKQPAIESTYPKGVNTVVM